VVGPRTGAEWLVSGVGTSPSHGEDRAGKRTCRAARQPDPNRNAIGRGRVMMTTSAPFGSGPRRAPVGAQLAFVEAAGAMDFHQT
jgi:hypothetical protein